MYRKHGWWCRVAGNLLPLSFSGKRKLALLCGLFYHENNSYRVYIYACNL